MQELLLGFNFVIHPLLWDLRKVMQESLLGFNFIIHPLLRDARFKCVLAKVICLYAEEERHVKTEMLQIVYISIIIIQFKNIPACQIYDIKC